MSSGYVSIAAFGAVGDGRTDNQAAIQNAFDYAHAHGLEVFVPRGVFSHSGTLTANGITVFGTGTGSVLHGTDPSQESLYLHGSGATVSSLELTTEAGPRLSSPDCTAICADHCTNYRIANVTIEHSGSAVIMNYGSDHGTIINNTVLDTNADSIHMIDGAHDITVQGNLVERSGDDSISVVNYGTDSSGSTNITIKGNTILDQQWGRGITVAGGHAIAIVGNHVEGGPADRAGIYISAESACSTPGNYGITVEGNTLKGAGGAQSGQGAIMVWNGEGGSITNHNIAITNNEIDAPRKDGILIIGSPQANLVVEHNTVYAPHGAAVDVADAPINSAIAGNPVLSQASYRGDIVPAGGGIHPALASEAMHHDVSPHLESFDAAHAGHAAAMIG